MRLAFDGYVLDVARRELRRGMELIAVEPQVFDLLLHLAQNPDRVIGRDELLRAVWNGRIVSDSAVTNRITAARRAIGDSGEAQRLIRTVPRRGIRFVATVEQQAEQRQVEPARARRPRGSRPIWPTAASALIGAAIAVVVAAWPQLISGLPISRPATAAPPGVLVSTLPLKPPGAGADDPGLTAPTSREASLGLDALSPPPAKAPAATAKPPREMAAATPPTVPVLPAAVSPTPVAAPQAQKAPLPDVAVITPAPIQPANPTNPPSGVDEATWRVIPCAAARIDLGAGAKCQAGLPVGGGLCDIARQVTMITNAHYQIEADVKIFDPTKITAAGYPGRNCTIWSGFRNLPDDFKDMNQMARRGTGWSNFVKGDAQSTASFVESGRNCVAVERLGPVWHGGYVWVVHASICPAAGGAVHNADIDAVFAMLQLRTYDAQGNLRASLQ